MVIRASIPSVIHIHKRIHFVSGWIGKIKQRSTSSQVVLFGNFSGKWSRYRCIGIIRSLCTFKRLIDVLVYLLHGCINFVFNRPFCNGILELCGFGCVRCLLGLFMLYVLNLTVFGKNLQRLKYLCPTTCTLAFRRSKKICGLRRTLRLGATSGWSNIFKNAKHGGYGRLIVVCTKCAGSKPLNNFRYRNNKYRKRKNNAYDPKKYPHAIRKKAKYLQYRTNDDRRNAILTVFLYEIYILSNWSVVEEILMWSIIVGNNNDRAIPLCYQLAGGLMLCNNVLAPHTRSNACKHIVSVKILQHK